MPMPISPSELIDSKPVTISTIFHYFSGRTFRLKSVSEARTGSYRRIGDGRGQAAALF